MFKNLQPYWLTFIVLFVIIAFISIVDLLFCLMSVSPHCQKDNNNPFDYVLDHKNDKISTHVAKDFTQKEVHYA